MPLRCSCRDSHSLYQAQTDTDQVDAADQIDVEAAYYRQPALPAPEFKNLAAAMDAIGRRIDPAKDTLLLVLTSHGSSDHHLSVQFFPLGMDALCPRMLKAMLKRAGIRYRVVVVSACYSGGFLDALEDGNTLIITGSGRTRTSFGCSTERNFTYFGEACFRDAPNRASSFTKALVVARCIMGAREAHEGDGPSEPQMFVGRKIAGMLTSVNTGSAGIPTAAAGNDEQ